jgi:hypothetical protein
MRKIRTLLALATALPFLACSSSRIQTDFDHQADFSTYTSYSWYEALTKDGGPTDGPSQIIDGRIRRAIGDNLRARGFTLGENATADLLVTYYTSLGSHTVLHTTGWGLGWGWSPTWTFGYGFWPGWSYTTVHTYHEGTIIIDIIDREQNQLVWRGVTSRVLGKKSHSDEEIARSMARVFAEFPPA